MTVTDILHKYSLDSALLFRAFELNEFTWENCAEFKKRQKLLRDGAEDMIRKAIQEESE